MYEAIETSREGGVAIVRLNRPKQLNALNATLAKEIISAVENLERDRAIGAIVLTGSERAFAAGADIAELSQKTAAEMIEADYFAEWERFTRCRAPKIAAVRGFALGAGANW
jgi:enoyl-CoA hydratase